MENYTNSDVEELLSKNHYEGNEDLREDYEFLWMYMRQKEFSGAKKIMRGFISGKLPAGQRVRSANNMIHFATKELDRLFHEELALTFQDLPKEKNEQIREWCGELSKIYSPLRKLIAY